MAKILVVDDSKTIRALFKRTLEMVGHEVTEAVDGQDGLVKVDETLFDLILSDINMPEMDGLTMCKHIKAKEKYAKIPIVVISTEANPEMKAKGKAIGVIGWMIKPPDPDQLVDSVTKVLKMTKALHHPS